MRRQRRLFSDRQTEPPPPRRVLVADLRENFGAAFDGVVASLTPHQRMIFDAYFNENLTLKEIGSRMALTVSAVAHVVGRIRKRFAAARLPIPKHPRDASDFDFEDVNLMRDPAGVATRPPAIAG